MLINENNMMRCFYCGVLRPKSATRPTHLCDGCKAERAHNLKVKELAAELATYDVEVDRICDKIIAGDKKETPDGMLPAVVYQMCVQGALIAGSLAKKMCGDEDIEPGDYDLLVPLERWQTIALLIPENAKPNKFGGWRFYTDKNEEVDVWPDTVQNYLSKCKTKYGGKVCVVDFINNKAFCSFQVEI